MKDKIKYTDEPLGKVKIIDDFLPPPEQLIFKEDSVRVSINLSKTSLKFFKELADANHVPYQKMIRKLLDEYVQRHKSQHQ